MKIPLPDAPSPVRGRGGIWIAFGALGGAVSWATHLCAIYALLPIACWTSSGLVIHLTTLLFGAVAGGAMFVSVRGWRRQPPGTDARWLGLAGVLLNAIFLLAIVLEGAAAFVVDPCI